MLYRLKMEESLEQPDQPPPCITIQGEVDVDYDWLQQHAAKALLCLKKPSSSIAVLVINDDEMAELHQKHSGIEGTTDVLTFDNGSSSDAIIADIAVCVDVANRESKNRGHSLQHELLLYIVHGVLHCCGFDDCDKESHRKIHAEENRVLAAIGVGEIWGTSS